MINFDEYSTRYKNIMMERRNGVLQITFHTDGDSLKWGGVHLDFTDAFRNIASDHDNRVVIVTGSGESFCAELGGRSRTEFPTAVKRWANTVWEANQMLMSFLDIEAPIISAVNGPVRVHPELPAIADIVLASETACFQDSGHFPRGIVPGDGNHIVWPHLLGTTRGRYFLLTGQEISATEALALGIVNEVLPATQLLPRAWTLAEQLSAKPDLALRYTKIALSLPLKRLVQSDLGYGLAMEAFAAVDE